MSESKSNDRLWKRRLAVTVIVGAASFYAVMATRMLLDGPALEKVRREHFSSAAFAAWSWRDDQQTDVMAGALRAPVRRPAPSLSVAAQ